MKKIITKILGYILSILFVILLLPIGLVYLFASVFWKVFGTTVIAFIILMLLGSTMEECLKYSSSLGFFVGVYLKYREMKKT